MKNYWLQCADNEAFSGGIWYYNHSTAVTRTATVPHTSVTSAPVAGTTVYCRVRAVDDVEDSQGDINNANGNKSAWSPVVSKVVPAAPIPNTTPPTAGAFTYPLVNTGTRSVGSIAMSITFTDSTNNIGEIKKWWGNSEPSWTTNTDGGTKTRTESIVLPTNFVPGVYRANFNAKDVAGNISITYNSEEITLLSPSTSCSSSAVGASCKNRIDFSRLNPNDCGTGFTYRYGACGQEFLCCLPNSALPTATLTPAATNTPGATRTPTPTSPPASTPTITPTPNATCDCQPNGSCHSSCVFNGVASGQGNTIKCSFNLNEELSYLTAPSLEFEKKSWCNRPARTTGDVTGDGKSVLGYMYYVQAINGGSIPALVNPDANGSGYLSPADGILIKP